MFCRFWVFVMRVVLLRCWIILLVVSLRLLVVRISLVCVFSVLVWL